MITTLRRVAIWAGISEDDVGKSAGTTALTLTNTADEEYQVSGGYADVRSTGNTDPITVYKGDDGVVTYVNASTPQWYLNAYVNVYVPRTVTLDHAMLEFDVRLKAFSEYLATLPSLVEKFTTSHYSLFYVRFIGRSYSFGDTGDFGLILCPLNDKMWIYAYAVNNANAVTSPMPQKFIQGEWTHIRTYRRTVNGTLYSVLEVDGKTLLTIATTQSSDLDTYYIGTGGLCSQSSTPTYMTVPYIEVSNIRLTALVETEIDENAKPVELAIGD